MIHLENITKIYQMGTETLKAADNVSLYIEKGDFISFRGASGSGKSTMMNIIGCLDRDYKGNYVLDGEDISNMPDGNLAEIRNRKIGFVHQNFNLLPKLTALQNVEIPLIYTPMKKSNRIRQASEALDAVGLADRKNHLPVQMSGGQQQRVAIARALVNNAPIILADEPTGNLDSRSGVEIMSILERLNERGATIVLVTHEEDIARWAKKSTFFKDGKLGSNI